MKLSKIKNVAGIIERRKYIVTLCCYLKKYFIHYIFSRLFENLSDILFGKEIMFPIFSKILLFAKIGNKNIF